MIGSVGYEQGGCGRVGGVVGASRGCWYVVMVGGGVGRWVGGWGGWRVGGRGVFWGGGGGGGGHDFTGTAIPSVMRGRASHPMPL